MSTLVVAGATGRVGSAVASELLAGGRKIKIVVRDAARATSWKQRGAELAVGSLADQAFLTSALQGADGFFALLPEDPRAADFHGTRRRMADSIAAAVRASRVPHVVMISSIGAHLDRGNGPIQDLHYLETALLATGASVSVVRSGFFQDNVANVLVPARQMGIYPNFAASADFPFPMTATRDAGRLAARLLASPPAKGEIVNLLGPAYSIRQVAEKLGAALGKTLQVVDIPAAGHVAALTQAGMSPSMAEALAEMYAALATGRIVPTGDRTEAATTTIDEVLPGLVGAPAASR